MTGFADIFIVGALFVEKILETGYDGHLKIDDVKTYLSEKIRSLIYTLNWEFNNEDSLIFRNPFWTAAKFGGLLKDYVQEIV